MKNSSIAPRKKGSWIKNRLGINKPETTTTESTITKEYLDEYINKIHPIKGNAFNILFSSDDLNKYNVIPYLLSKKVDQSKAIEFAIQKENYQQADDLIKNLNFNIISAIQNKSLTLVQYFVEEKGSDVNFNCFGSNTLSIAASLEEPNKTEITYYLLTKGATYLNTTLEEVEQDSQNVNDFYKQIFFKAVKEENFEIIKNLTENPNFNVDATYLDNTALSIAINFEDKKIANHLISKKANTTAAMSAAATEGNLEGIKILLDKKADINGNKDESPLMLASEHGHVEVVQYLLKHGAKHNVQGWCSGGVTTNLYTDVDVQVKKLSVLWEKANNTNIDFPELIKYFQNILDEISLTSISSNYNGYKNLPLEQIKEQFPKFLEQLYKDFQKFTEIKNLLEDYSSGRKILINTNIVVDDEGCVSDTNGEPNKSHKTGSRLEHTPSKSGIFNTFSLEGLNELDEDPTSLGGDITDIFDSEFNSSNRT